MKFIFKLESSNCLSQKISRQCRQFLAVTAVLIFGVFVWSSHALAQDNTSSPTNSIAGAVSDSLRPVAVISRRDIELSGASSLRDLMFSNGRDYNSFGLYRSFVLGPGNMAFLLNGKVTSISVIEVLPLAAVNRIEILNDSAVALYGGNSSGGAINVVLERPDIEGFDGWVGAERPSQRGSDTEYTGALWSPKMEQGSAMAGVEYWKREEIRSADRSFSKAKWKPGGSIGDTQGVSESGNTVYSGEQAAIVGTCNTTLYTGPITDSDGHEICGFPYANYSFLLKGEERTNFFFNFETELNGESQAYSDFIVAKRKTHDRYAPSTGTFSIPASALPQDHNFYSTVPDKNVFAGSSFHRPWKSRLVDGQRNCRNDCRI